VPQQLVEAAGLGAIDCLRKPFSIQTLRTTVREVLSRSIDDRDSPESADEFLERGKRNLMLGILTDARSDLQRTVDLQPSMAEAWVLLGVVSILESRDSEAEERFRTALRFDPSNKNASEYLAWCGS
jgi:lipoprotein NlpI